MIWKKLFGKEEKPQETITEPRTAPIPTPPETPIQQPTEIIGGKQASSSAATEISPQLEPLFHFNDETISAPQETTPVKEKSRLVRFLDGLKKSRKQITGAFGNILSGGVVSIEMLDDLEDILIQADLGTEVSAMMRKKIEQEKFGANISENELKTFLSKEIETLLNPVAQKLILKKDVKPNVLLFVGVNGSGKTTSIGKFAKHFKQAGLNVMLAAGDTFRAAAVEQLTIWGERNDVPVYAKPQGSDAAGLVYDAYAEALKNNTDILLIDTAGRLQNKHNLMQELIKIVRVLQKYDATLPHEIIMVLDATTGQNAMRQAEIFRDMADISGIVITKLDGTAKGGVLVPISYKIKLPVYAIGIGENIEDLKPFHATDFTKGLIGETISEEEIPQG